MNTVGVEESRIRIQPAFAASDVQCADGHYRESELAAFEWQQLADF